MASYGEDEDAIAAFEDEDDYVMVFASVPSPSSHVAGTAMSMSSSWSSLADDVQAEEEEQMPSPLISSISAASSACDEHDVVEMAGAAAAEVDAAMAAAQEYAAVTAPPPFGWAYAAAAESEEDGDEVITDDDEEDEDDYMYQAHYDRADRGRSRHAKRSSGRRGRTKKASTMGRPRGGHLSHGAGDV